MATKTPQKRALAYPPPASIEDADKALGDIGECCRAIETLTAEAEGEIAAVIAKASPKLRLNAEKVQAKFKALFRWARDKRAQLFAGEKKSLALPQGTLGFRDTPGKVVVEEGRDEEELAQQLLARGFGEFVRQSVKLDRQAILKNPEKAEAIPEISIEGGEVFFADPIGVDFERVKLKQKIELGKKPKLTARPRAPKEGAGAVAGGGPREAA